MLSLTQRIGGAVAAVTIACNIPGAIQPGATEQGLSFHIRRAIGVENFLTVLRDQSGGVVFPYYKRWGEAHTIETLKQLKAAGFDSIRLVIEPAPLLRVDEATRLTIYPLFHEAVAEILEAGLNVVFNLHVTHRDPVWNPRQITADLSGENFRVYKEMTRSVGRFLVAYDPSRVALEIFNEPPCEPTAQPRWPKFQKQLFDTARRSMPNHTIIVTGSCFGSIKGLKQLNPRDYDKNTIFTFHFYEPGLFTNQGLPWLPGGYKFVRRLPYPPIADRSDEIIASMDREVDAFPNLDFISKARLKLENRGSIRTYFRRPMNRRWVKSQFEPAVAWGKMMRLSPNRIFVGEFGAARDYRGINAGAREDRLRWLEDVRTLFEEAGFSWSVWSDCCEFGIETSHDPRMLDAGVLKALGLMDARSGAR